ncbi:response regulator transcription factor [Lactobacillus sp. ESL0701]|uniref:response regulator transcription factor n=1 Tax=Lactobacillus sp. ESL0701 TaxID=2983217 RepID=UPI0023F8CCDE|nr:response regulator transcription factor [Lactobacillus sp. ESL0701]MDF7672337.1 response regulator transcription factor [Lactobacillus sp. ESL0701]
MSKILVVDDDQDLLVLVKRALTREGYTVDTRCSTKELTAESCRFYQLLLVDVMMPDEDGFDFCQRIRPVYDGPIIFLTAKTDDAALVRGLGLGGDDYIKKPFSLAELRARVNAHLRREQRQPLHAYERSGVLFNLSERKAYVRGESVPFTKGEFQLAAQLAEHPGQVYTKEQLYETVFGFNTAHDNAAIAEHIKNIRAKLKMFSLTPIITVWGVGYKWQEEGVFPTY